MGQSAARLGLPNIVAHVFSIVGLGRAPGSRIRDDVPGFSPHEFPHQSPRPIQGESCFSFLFGGEGNRGEPRHGAARSKCDYHVIYPSSRTSLRLDSARPVTNKPIWKNVIGSNPNRPPRQPVGSGFTHQPTNQNQPESNPKKRLVETTQHLLMT